MRGERGTKKSFSLRSKLHFVTDRCRPNLHCLYSTDSKHKVCCLSHPGAMRGQRGSKNCSATRIECPSLLPDFDQTYTGYKIRSGSARFSISVIPLQSQARHGGKTISDSRVNCRMLLTYVGQTRTAVQGEEGVQGLLSQSSRCNARRDRDEKPVRPQE
jgi:hypothetical protein